MFNDTDDIMSYKRFVLIFGTLINWFENSFLFLFENFLLRFWFLLGVATLSVICRSLYLIQILSLSTLLSLAELK